MLCSVSPGGRRGMEGGGGGRLLCAVLCELLCGLWRKEGVKTGAFGCKTCS